MPSHARGRAPRRGLIPIAGAIALVLAIAALTVVRIDHRAAAARAASAQSAADASDAAESAASAAVVGEQSSAAASASAASASASAAAAVQSSQIVAEQVASHAALQSDIEGLAAGKSADSISIAALNTTTGASYQWGATGGMLTGSIVKLYILETLLLQEQGSGGLTSGQAATATRMIENSDNDAAETLFEAVGGRTALLAANARLGLTNTTPGPTDYWGLTQTCASDYLSLLKNLIMPSSPLTAASQAYILGLMRNVEADQRWGVGVTADPGTDFANKNGWLAVDDDSDLWLVNSVGVLTIQGQQVLMVVLTQHDSDFDTGINLVQSLATAIKPLVVAS